MDTIERLYQRIEELEKKNAELIRQNNQLKVEKWKLEEAFRKYKKEADWKQEGAISTPKPKN